ncbi:MAG: CesT family type III secretion system chaperone [Desulfobacterales bacterium]|nr:CesT family type III secretion system chaperone [Desulfobacterales bacterium]
MSPAKSDTDARAQAERTAARVRRLAQRLEELLSDGLSPGERLLLRIPFSGDMARVLAMEGQQLLCEARVAHLPAEPMSKRNALRVYLQRAAGRMLPSPASLVCDPTGRYLLMQQRAQATSPSQLAVELDAFVTEVSQWKRIDPSRASRPRSGSHGPALFA